jgi:AcrR family transcriptional regulator
MFTMSTSKRRAGYHHGDLSAALIRAALQVIEAEGAEELTLRGLAARAGVSAMAPYRHFADKAALLEAVAVEGFRMMRAAFADVDEPSNARRASRPLPPDVRRAAADARRRAGG